MGMMQALAVGAMVAGGLALVVQAPINAALARTLGGSMPAAAVSFGVGFVVLLTASALTGQGGAFARAAGAPPWLFLGGALGAFYVWTVVWTVQSLGVVTMLAAAILGQVAGALVLDATGAFGLPVREITPTRVAAAGMVLGGLVLSRL